MKNAYLVLSVKNIEVLLAAAKASAAAVADDSGLHCITLRNIDVGGDGGGEVQIGSCSLVGAAENIIDEVQTRTQVCTLDLRNPDVMEAFCNRHAPMPNPVLHSANLK